MWYKHKHRKKAHRTEHRRGGSRAVLTQTSAAPGGMIHLLPRIQSYPILGPVLCLFKPLWLSRKEDQSTHWAGQQLSSASSTNFQPPCFIQCSAVQCSWGGEDCSRQHPWPEPGGSTCTSSHGPGHQLGDHQWRKKLGFCQWHFWISRQCSIFSSVVQSVFTEQDVWS